MAIEFRIKVIKSTTGVMATKNEIVGYVDASTLTQFEQVLGKLVQKGAKNIILDCSKLEYINSTGLGLFLKYTDELRKIGGRLAVTKLPQATQKVVQMLGFDRDLKLLTDDAAALKWFGDIQTTTTKSK